jgi:hypothetical protein
MKPIKIVLILLLFAGAAKGQSFSNTDSLRDYINKYIRTSPTTAFTNLRLNTALLGLANWIDSTSSKITGGTRKVDTLYRVNDSTIGYKVNGTARSFLIKGTGGTGGVITETDPLAVKLAGSYTNPSFLVSIPSSKISDFTTAGRGLLSSGYGWTYTSGTGVGKVDTSTSALSGKYLRIVDTSALGRKTDTTTFYRDATIKGSFTQASPGSLGGIHIVTDANYTVAADDLTVVFSTQSATRTLTLPTASTSMNRVIHIKASSTNTVTLSIAVKTIGGSTFTSVSTSGELSIQSDGVDWWAFRKSF